MASDQELVTSGPVAHVALLDATWQGEPEWGSDPWVALDGPDLVYQGPPFPGVLVRFGISDQEAVRVSVSNSVPDWAPVHVATSELMVGSHGFHLSVGDVTRSVRRDEGNYSLEVWVDQVRPGHAKSVALVLGPRQPRRLPDHVK